VLFHISFNIVLLRFVLSNFTRSALTVYHFPICVRLSVSLSALTLLFGQPEGRLVCYYDGGDKLIGALRAL